MENTKNSRRSFIRKAACGSLAAISIPSILSSCASDNNGIKIELLKDHKILFQGDSITDSGRNKEIDGFNNAWVLGNGYPYLTAAREIAAQFDAIFIPYQSIYDEAQNHAPGSYWTFDGVHPSLAGAQLMAEAWLSVIE